MLLLFWVFSFANGQCECLTEDSAYPFSSRDGTLVDGDGECLDGHWFHLPGGSGRVCRAKEYGLSQCAAWDEGTAPYCDGDAPPDFCTAKWCYVNATCSTKSKVAYLDNAFVSYETCGSTDSFTSWWASSDIHTLAAGTLSIKGIQKLIENQLLTIKSDVESTYMLRASMNVTWEEYCHPQHVCTCPACTPSPIWYGLGVDFDSFQIFFSNQSQDFRGWDGTQFQCIGRVAGGGFVKFSQREWTGSTQAQQLLGDHRTGASVTWPKVGGLCDDHAKFFNNSNNTYDARMQSWYTASYSPPKDFVVVIDASEESLRNSTYVDKIKAAAIAILSTAGPNDKFTVVIFNTHSTRYPNSAIQLTDIRSKSAIAEFIDKTVFPEGHVDWKVGFQAAIDILTSARNQGPSSGCKQALFFLSGAERSGWTDRSWLSCSLAADTALLTYTFYDGATTGIFPITTNASLFSVSCDNNGIAFGIGINANAPDFHSAVTAHEDLFANSLEDDCNIIWTVNYPMMGRPKTLACVPTFDHSNSTRVVPAFAGVLCNDLGIVIDEAILGSNCLSPFQEFNNANAIHARKCPSTTSLRDPCLISFLRSTLPAAGSCRTLKYQNEPGNCTSQLDESSCFIRHAKDYQDFPINDCYLSSTVKSPSDNGGNSDVGLIVGLVLGGLLLILAVFLLIFKKRLKRKKDVEISSYVPLGPETLFSEKELDEMEVGRSIQGDKLSFGPVIGKGANSRICKGLYLGAPVAIKEISTALLKTAAKEKRVFLNELSMLRRLRHPNIIQLYGGCILKSRDAVEGVRLIIVTELAEMSLRNLMDTESILLDRALDIAEQTARGCLYMHSMHLVHFDIKPPNILIDFAGKVKICDLGISHICSSNQDTLMNTLVDIGGTPSYMAPELLSGHASPASFKVDVYSWALVLWELLHNQRTHPRSWSMAVLFSNVLNNDYRPAIGEYLSSELRELLTCAWNKDPEQRPAFDAILFSNVLVEHRKNLQYDVSPGSSTSGEHSSSPVSPKSESNDITFMLSGNTITLRSSSISTTGYMVANNSHQRCFIRSDLLYIKEIGSGFTSKVFMAVHVASLELFAVKVIKVYKQVGRHSLDRELTATDLQHVEALNSILGAFYDPIEQEVHMISRLMDSGSCFDNWSIFADETLLACVTKSVLTGLEALHSAGKLHRDIKPENILLDSTMGAKLADFGLLRELNEGGVADTFVGTISYMSPERLAGREYSSSADIWSLGVALISLLDGSCAFDGQSFFEIYGAIEAIGPPAVKDTCVSTMFRDFVYQCTFIDASLRKTAEQLLAHPFLMVADQVKFRSLLQPLNHKLQDTDEFISTLIDRMALYTRTEGEADVPIENLNKIERVLGVSKDILLQRMKSM